MSVYLNNQGAGTFGGEVWGAGDDANDGLSRAAPKLTANSPFDLYSYAGEDGEALAINDGTYTYTNGDGRWIISHDEATIEFQNDLQTVLVFSGSNVQGFRFNGSNTVERSLTVGDAEKRGYFTTENAAKRTQIIISGNSATARTVTLNWNSFVIPQSGGINQQIGLSLEAANIDATINGGTTAQGGGLVDIGSTGTYRPIRQNPALTAMVSVDIDIQSWEFDLRCAFVGGLGAISLASNPLVQAGTWKIKGVTGAVVEASTGTSVSYLAHMDNPPTGSYIEECNDVSYSSEGSGRGVGLYQIASPDHPSPNCFIRNCKRNRLHSENGVGLVVIIGADGSDHDNDNGWIYGMELECTVGDGVTNRLHGISHIGVTNGIRAYNIITGVSIGSLTKAATALSFGNTYEIDPDSASENHLQAKGAEDGSEFFNERCIVLDGFGGNICQALEDDTFSQQDSVNTIFRDIKVEMRSGDIAPSAELVLIGGANDTSTGTVEGLLINENVDLSLLTNIARIDGVAINSLADLDAHASVRLAIQQSVPSGSAASGGGSGGGPRPIISSVFG